ncbi:hypothetical protein Bca52824_048738 [Brassica carinata]|uniref:Uncharacterized protein n=1 Tax=Brassica carinata TaxID=52824 RepID=A0A8X7RP70_BRACI|nr:hypothetical protein Bca52824_048738 [Brassica carinata]
MGRSRTWLFLIGPGSGKRARGNKNEIIRDEEKKRKEERRRFMRFDLLEPLKLRNMGQDYSYTQPSSSEDSSLDITSLLQAEADIYADEAQSMHNISEPYHYPPQPEADDGIPKTCYCGADPVVAASYTSKDPGRRDVPIGCLCPAEFVHRNLYGDHVGWKSYGG